MVASMIKLNVGAFIRGLVFVLAMMVNHAAATPTIKAAGDSFWNTHVRLCAMNEAGDCNYSEYAKSVARFGIPGVFFAALTLLCFVLFVPIRFCCNGCGGKNPSEGICPDKDDRKLYTKNQILWVKIAAIIVIIPIIIGAGIGYQGNSQISSEVKNITATISTSGDTILANLQSAQQIVTSLTDDSSAASALADAVSTATTVNGDIHSTRDNIYKYDNIRKNIMIVGFAFCLVIVVLGAIAAIFNIRPLAMTLALKGFAILVLIWLTFGIHLVAGKVIYDVCVDVNLLTNSTTADNTTSIFKTGPLGKLWACDNNTNLNTLQTEIDELVQDTANDACSFRANLCGTSNWQCQPLPKCGADTLDEVTDAQHMTVLDGGTQRSVSNCAAQCSNSNYRNASASMLKFVTTFDNFTHVYYDLVLPIVQCKVTEDLFTSVRGSLCVDMFNSLYGVAISSLIIAIFFTPFVAFMVVGFKRFQSFNSGSNSKRVMLDSR